MLEEASCSTQNKYRRYIWDLRPFPSEFDPNLVGFLGIKRAHLHASQHDSIDPVIVSQRRIVVTVHPYFLAPALLVPPLRWLIVGRFERHIERLKSPNPDAVIDVVAHSFGTYVVSRVLWRLSRLGGAKTGQSTVCNRGSHTTMTVICYLNQ